MIRVVTNVAINVATSLERKNSLAIHGALVLKIIVNGMTLSLISLVTPPSLFVEFNP